MVSHIEDRAAFLRAAIAARGIKHERCARHVGMRASRFSEMLHNEYPVKDEVWKKLIKFLEVEQEAKRFDVLSQGFQMVGEDANGR